MVNYVLSFCKITGASKIFTRNFYLPLLKPLTPKEALRTLRITGKWLLGSKVQHYIPVLLNSETKQRSVKSKGKNSHEIHDEMPDYTYMTPVLDPENETHQILLNILKTTKNDAIIKKNDDETMFVYTVDDKKYNIVLEARLELAIRNGDIIDVLVSQKNDKIIVKLNNFKKIPMEIQYYDYDNDKSMLYCGEGATTPSEEKHHHHGKYTMSLAKIFEDKELIEERWEEELKKIMRKRRKQTKASAKEWKAIMKESIKNLDWKKFEEDARKVIDEIAEPVQEHDIEMEIDDLDATKHVNETIMIDTLPTIQEIPDIIKGMASAELHHIENPNDVNMGVCGVKVKLASGKECFVSGQMVHTEDGDVFVPGQTIENEYGVEYAPGITINVDNKPMLINGLIMGEEAREPMFLPTQSAITADGQLTFATDPQERPPPLPENERLLRRRSNKLIVDEKDDQNIVTIIESDDDDDKSSRKSVELSNSEIEELDLEAIRLKHQEQQRMEIDKLKMILLDDGMDDLILSLEQKKMKLKQKLDELRRLSISTENSLISYINENDTMEIASKITENNLIINRISDILMTIIRRAATFRDKNSINADNINHSFTNIIASLSNDDNDNNSELILDETDVRFNNCPKKLQVLLKTCFVAANDVFKNRPKDQILALNTVGEIMIDVLMTKTNNNNNDHQQLLDDLLNLMNTPNERNEISNAILKQLTRKIHESKITQVQNLAATIVGSTDYDIFEMLQKIFDGNNNKNNDETSKVQAFIKIAKIDQLVLVDLIKNLNQQQFDRAIKTDQDAINCVEMAIVRSIRRLMERNLERILMYRNDSIKEFKEEALNFAIALDLDNVVNSLMIHDNLQDITDKQTIELLKRVTLIKQLAERDYSLKSAIDRIRRNVERAKCDPRVRQLVRESAILIANQSYSIRNSRDIPLQIIKTQNLLAIEDYLMQRIRIDRPVLINRNTYQAVIPREAARGVLAGRVPYLLIDETGITHFKPMHMFAACNLNKNREKRIDNYLNVGASEQQQDEATMKMKINNNTSSSADAASWNSPRSLQTMNSGTLYRGYTGPRA